MICTDPLVSEAAHFALASHAGQVRKYTGLPYFTHVYDVAKLVAEHTADAEMIAAALLHDTVEDTGVTPEQLTRHFGDNVSTLVVELTDVYTEPHHGNRTQRKTLEAARLATISARAQSIKLADLIDNTHTIAALDAKFAHTYLDEKQRYLSVLTNGDLRLYNRACSTLEAARARLKSATS